MEEGSHILNILRTCQDADVDFESIYETDIKRIYNHCLTTFIDFDIIGSYKINEIEWLEFLKKNSTLYEKKCAQFVANVLDNEDTEENTEDSYDDFIEKK